MIQSTFECVSRAVRQMGRVRLLLFGFIAMSVVSPERASGDTLAVDTKFPSIAFNMVAADGLQKTTLTQVQRGKAIVFVYASW